MIEAVHVAFVSEYRPSTREFIEHFVGAFASEKEATQSLESIGGSSSTLKARPGFMAEPPDDTQIDTKILKGWQTLVREHNARLETKSSKTMCGDLYLAFATEYRARNDEFLAHFVGVFNSGKEALNAMKGIDTCENRAINSVWVTCVDRQLQ